MPLQSNVDTQPSTAALQFRQTVQDPDNFLKSCDGGDVGSPTSRSIWLIGIEPGWSLADQLNDAREPDARAAELDAYSIDLQLGWPYNRNAFKLLAALDGGAPEDYVSFASAKRPFERGCTGYFKGNLFPEAFHNVGAWDKAATDVTGFQSKAEYQSWVRTTRLPILNSWIEKCRPRLVIGVGLAHLQDFMTAAKVTETPGPNVFEVNGHAKRMYLATDGMVPLAVIPHLSGGPNGLNSNRAIQCAANHIRDALQWI